VTCVTDFSRPEPIYTLSSRAKCDLSERKITRSRGTLCCGSSMREYIFYVYMLQSASRRALYIGMTNNLRHRVFQHKTHQNEGFTNDYNATRLVYWEKFESVGKAIAREKQLKRWRREKKMWLVETMNPKWRDLAADWYPTPTQGLSTPQPVRPADGPLRSR
jgi:putative endonuclease